MMQIRDCVYTSHVSSENRHNIMTSLGIYVGLLILTVPDDSSDALLNPRKRHNSLVFVSVLGTNRTENYLEILRLNLELCLAEANHSCGNGATSHSRNPFGDDLDDGDRIEPEEFRPETFEPQSTKGMYIAASNNSEEVFFEQGDGADLSKLADFSGMQMKGVNTMKKDKAVHPGSTLDGVTVENAEKVTPDASLEEVTTVEKVASVAEEKRNPSEVQLQIVEELRRGRIPKAEVAALLRKTSANQLLYLKNLNKLNSFGVRAMTVEPDGNVSAEPFFPEPASVRAKAKVDIMSKKHGNIMSVGPLKSTFEIVRAKRARGGLPFVAMITIRISILLMLMSCYLAAATYRSVLDDSHEDDLLGNIWNGTFDSFLDKNGKKFEIDKPAIDDLDDAQNKVLFFERARANVDIVRKERDLSKMPGFLGSLGSLPFPAEFGNRFIKSKKSEEKRLWQQSPTFPMSGSPAKASLESSSSVKNDDEKAECDTSMTYFKGE
ncbi:unnamed protein product [Notodromas monacha]|uniref:Uncharacterized protein n=1 Tax=Notodromas monacha TaxID=399045 RepID=A0A7R9BQJ9_9CRUS|nr:unnamed protein product [Notodromas monacha]CAG0918752.1 unnamed protein product [Notodromas monacha]